MVATLAGNIFKCIFFNENIWISSNISLIFVPNDPINNIQAMVQIMAWHWAGNKPFFEPMMAYFTDKYMHLLVSMI